MTINIYLTTSEPVIRHAVSKVFEDQDTDLHIYYQDIVFEDLLSSPPTMFDYIIDVDLHNLLLTAVTLHKCNCIRIKAHESLKTSIVNSLKTILARF